MKDFIRLAIAALDDPNGINEAAWDVIEEKLHSQVYQIDATIVGWQANPTAQAIMNQTRSAEGRYYLPEDHGIKVD